MKLDGKVVLLTGASRGIGAATALELASRGAHVILTARNHNALASLKEEIAATTGRADAIAVDLEEARSVDKLANQVSRISDRLDAIIINAAFAPARIRVQDIDPAELETAMKVNVLATQALISAFHPMLDKSEAGRMIGITSAAALAPFPGFAAYAASKAAFDMILHTYAVDNAKTSNIRTALIAPGATRTEMRAEGFPDEDPMTVKPAEFVANSIVDLIEQDFPNDTYVDVQKLYLELS